MTNAERFVHDPDIQVSLDHYAAASQLAAQVEALRNTAAHWAAKLEGRTVWMLNSTPAGGGVAELIPAQIALLRELGLDVRWLVMDVAEQEFFALTKRLHNMIHGQVGEAPSADEQNLYDAVSEGHAEAIAPLLRPADILLVHDPQPLGVGAILRRELNIATVWRCHIGLDHDSASTRAAWSFLQPYTEPYPRAVFSLAEYAPAFLRDRLTVIHPTLDPFSHKNRGLTLHKLVGVLADAGLTVPHWPLLDPPFQHRARRLQSNGSLLDAIYPDDIGLLARPIITQVSRWDVLKGFEPLLAAFVDLKTKSRNYLDERHRRRVEIARLVLAGADPTGIQDDPEALAVFERLRDRFCALPPELQADVVILALPMQSLKQNALMVNTLQRSADIVAQNSLQEGFGLTVAEAMWKQTPVLGSARASGVRLQVRDGVDGRLVQDPENPVGIADLLHDMLSDAERLETWGRNAQHRVHAEFLIFRELQQWLQLLGELPVRPA